MPLGIKKNRKIVKPRKKGIPKPFEPKINAILPSQVSDPRNMHFVSELGGYKVLNDIVKTIDKHTDSIPDAKIDSLIKVVDNAIADPKNIVNIDILYNKINDIFINSSPIEQPLQNEINELIVKSYEVTIPEIPQTVIFPEKMPPVVAATDVVEFKPQEMGKLSKAIKNSIDYIKSIDGSNLMSAAQKSTALAGVIGKTILEFKKNNFPLQPEEEEYLGLHQEVARDLGSIIGSLNDIKDFVANKWSYFYPNVEPPKPIKNIIEQMPYLNTTILAPEIPNLAEKIEIAQDPLITPEPQAPQVKFLPTSQPEPIPEPEIPVPIEAQIAPELPELLPLTKDQYNELPLNEQIFHPSGVKYADLIKIKTPPLSTVDQVVNARIPLIREFREPQRRLPSIYDGQINVPMQMQMQPMSPLDSSNQTISNAKAMSGIEPMSGLEPTYRQRYDNMGDWDKFKSRMGLDYLL